MNIFTMTTLQKPAVSCVCQLITSLVLCSAFTNVATAQQQVLLYDNGGFVNRPGQGPGGADLSLVLPGWDVWGVPAVEYYGARVADDFTIPTGETWNISSARFFLYEYGTTTSLFTGMSLRIWDGSPLNPSSHVIWGDTTANVMSDTGFTGAYLKPADYPSSVAPIMWLDASINITLPAGTYWCDWATSLSDYSHGDPEQGFIPADLETRVGDALWTPFVPDWGQITDAGRPLDYPFQIFETVPEPSCCGLVLLGSSVICIGRFLRIRR
jgi:hypothetical protein